MESSGESSYFYNGKHYIRTIFEHFEDMKMNLGEFDLAVWRLQVGSSLRGDTREWPANVFWFVRNHDFQFDARV